MSASECAGSPPEVEEKIDYRWLAHVWESRCRYVSGHLQKWKQKALDFEKELKARAKELRELRAQRESDKAQIAWLQKQIFGQKTEQGHGVEAEEKGGGEAEGISSVCESELPAGRGERRKRGQQAGARGHGRRRRVELEVVEVVHPLAEEQRCCQRCGKPFVVLAGTEDSEEIDWEVRVVRRVHRRKRYRRACACPALPAIVTAPGPLKLIPKGLFSIDFWVRLLLEKFLFQRPLTRVQQVLQLEGLHVSAGTLIGGLQAIAPLLMPVYEMIKARSHQMSRRKMDETRWPVFIIQEGKKGYRWYMWIDVTPETVVYLLDPSRSAEVLKNHLGTWEGILLVDCYIAYQTHQAHLSKLGLKLILAFCWAHRRRDFVEVGEGYPRLRVWAESWVGTINELFRINDQRVEALSNPETFGAADARLRQALDAMVARRDQELLDLSLHPEQHYALRCLRRHWRGLTVFVDHPEIPMDNNEAERLFRLLAVGRKNYYGSGSRWSGDLSAHAFTIIQTLRLNHIDPKQWLSAYFTACAQNGSRPPQNIDAYLPWNLSFDKKHLWKYPRAP